MIDCTFENGSKASLRHVTVGVIAFNQNNQVLLVKRGSHLHRGNMYAIPGGFLDRGEDTKEGALRELKEETGMIGEIKYLFYINDSPFRPKEDRQNVDFIYVAQILSGSKELNKEVSQIEWFSQNSLPEEEEFAFDHRGIINLFFEHLKNPFTLPVMPEKGKI